MPEQQNKAIPVESKRTRYERMRAQLELERNSFMPHWRDLSDWILPRRGRFLSSDVNRGERRNQRIIDSTATTAVRNLKAGFMAGMTSPAREWKQLTTPDPAMAKVSRNKEWLSLVNEIMSDYIRRCGFYKNVPIVYGDMAVFATAAMGMQPDLSGRLMHLQPFAVGSYMVATNDQGRPVVFMRVFQMTVRQIINKFGQRNAKGEMDWSNISSVVKDYYERGNLEFWIEVCHVISPNEDHNPRYLFAKFKKFSSCYYETGSQRGSTSGNYMRDSNEEKFLRESGYDYFPILVPRWEITDGDSYGTDCPGMTCLGDAKGLQTGEKQIYRAGEKMINPPMVGPAELRTTKASTLPGDITYLTERSAAQGFRTAHDTNFPTDQMEVKQQQTRARIKRVFFEDIFLPIISDERRERQTAAEVAARKQDQLVLLGPTLENTNDDLLDPFVEAVFIEMVNQGRIPPPPPDLQGVNLGVQFISIMALAQKALGLGGMERFMSVAATISSLTGDVSLIHDKVDTDKMMESAGDMTGIPYGIVRDEEETQARRAARLNAQNQAAEAERANQGAETVERLSKASTDEPSALTELISAAKAGQAAP